MTEINSIDLMNKLVEQEKDKRKKMELLNQAEQELHKIKRKIKLLSLAEDKWKVKETDLKMYVKMAKHNYDLSEMDYWQAFRKWKQAEKEGR